MTKFVSYIFIAAALYVNAESFKGEILCDPVRQINSLTISKDAIVRESFHNINGEPVQCLRISILPGSSRTSLFIKVKINNPADKKINFICAIASAENNNKSAYCKLTANGTELFDAIVKTNQPVYLRGIPAIDNNKNINLVFEIYYNSSKTVFPVDLILPALISLQKCDDPAREPDIQFGITGAKKTWKISKIEKNKTADFKKDNSIFLVPKIILSEMISKSIDPQAGAPIKIVAILKNTGWKNYVSDPGNIIKIDAVNKTGVIDKDKQTQLIPAIPAGGVAEVEWTVRSYRNISKIKGRIVSPYLNTNTEFTIPLFNKYRFISKSNDKSGWERIINIKEKMIAYDWVQNNVRIRFVKAPSGIKNIQFAIKVNSKFKTVAVVDKLMSIDVITPNNKVITLNFSSKSIQYFEGEENKVLIRGWTFNKKIGGVTIEQYYSRPKNSTKINIETRITAKNNIKIANVHNPLFHIETDEKSNLVIPGFRLERILSHFKPEKNKWIFYNHVNEIIPLSMQLIPFLYVEGLNGSICFENPSGVFEKNNMMWLVGRKSIEKNGRCFVSNIAKPLSGTLLKCLEPDNVLSVKSSVSIIPENTDVASLLPDIIQLGILPVQLVDAEKERLVKHFIASIDCTNTFTYNEMKLQAELLLASRNRKWSAAVSTKINELYSCLTNKINTDKHTGISLQKLFIKYDWTLDKNVIGEKIIRKVGIKKINKDIFDLLNSGKKDAISLAENLLTKLRGKLIYNYNDYPDLLTYTKLAKANIIAYNISENKSFANEANRLLHLGEIFMRKSIENTTRGMGMAEEILGHNTTGNYAGLLSTEATIDFADALYEFAKMDTPKKAQKLRLANLLLEAVENFYIRENKNGLIPEFWSQEFNMNAGEYKRPYSLWSTFLKQNKLLN
ncbi:MAG: hypothetical protein DRI44_02750 [Chlamydiae bacterium]|nr:MAG: hypothetical protein DRI44_02750 [Chlamydiota bacterium]